MASKKKISKTKSPSKPLPKSTSTSTDKKIILCPEFNPDNLSFSDLDMDNERSQQLLAFPRYKYPSGNANLVFKTGWIKLTQYGFPKKGESPDKYFYKDSQRTFLKIPLDPTQQNCIDLQTMLNKIDTNVTTNKEKILKAFFKAKKLNSSKVDKFFQYTYMARKPQSNDDEDDDDDDENNDDDENKDEKDDKNTKKKSEDSKNDSDEENTKNEFVYFDYCKMAFAVTYEKDVDKNDQKKDIISGIFLREEEELSDDQEVIKADIKTASDLEALGLVWGSSIRMLVMVNKLWANKAKLTQAEGGKRGFGLTMKILQLEMIPNLSTGRNTDFNSYAFEDDRPINYHEKNTKKIPKSLKEPKVSTHIKSKDSKTTYEESSDDSDIDSGSSDDSSDSGSDTESTEN